MKSKKIAILLSTVVAGLGLVGATFAAWAVTDSADPLGIKISPGTIQDASYNTIVLEWGSKAEFKNVGGLELGEANAKSVSIGVKSTSSDGTSYTGGNLTIGTEDRTDRTGEVGTPERLINHLVIKTYLTRTGDGSETPYEFSNQVSALTLDSTHTSVNANIDTAAVGTEKTVYFKIYIDSTGLDVEKYNQMKNDLVYLTVDWNRPSTIPAGEIVTGTDVYYTCSEVPSVYAWNSVTLEANSLTFPGKTMSKVEGSTNLYTYKVDNKFNKVIFSYNDGATKTDDLDMPTSSDISAGKVYWDGDSWETVPVVEQTTYWLIGSMNGWTSGTTGYQFTVDPLDSNKYTLAVTTTQNNQEMKVIDGSNMHFWGKTSKGTSEGTDVFTLDTAGSYVLTLHLNGTQVEDTTFYITCVSA